MTNSLEHFGIKGMKWGVRRTPEQLGHRNLQKAKTANFDKWGKSPETNTLWITGRSGSGKSTVAKSIARPNDHIIHLDAYSDEASNGAGLQDKAFNAHLDKTVPNWRSITRKWGHDYSSKEYRDTVNKFASEIKNFSKDQYKKGNRVIAEGFQITSGWLYPDYDFYAGQPVAILGTGKARSLAQEFVRDKRDDPIIAIKEYFSKSGTTWSKSWDKKLSDITETTQAKRGSKSVDEYLKKYGQRKVR